jgi:TonB family protein
MASLRIYIPIVYPFVMDRVVLAFGQDGIESVAMRAAACFLLCSVILVNGLFSQTRVSSTGNSEDSFCKKLEDMRPYISISAGVAEKLLVQKAEPVYKHLPMEARVTGTVVIQFKLGKNGEVLCPRVVSGPRILQQPVLDAVRKYKYKPYLLNGEAIVVSTRVAVPASNY